MNLHRWMYGVPAAILLAAMPAQADVTLESTAGKNIFVRYKDIKLNHAVVQLQLHVSGKTPHTRSIVVTPEDGVLDHKAFLAIKKETDPNASGPANGFCCGEIGDEFEGGRVHVIVPFHCN